VVAWLIQLDGERDARELEELARRAGWPARAEHAAPSGIERSGLRVLLYAGLDPAGRRFLLERLVAERYAGLAALLRERPEILERAGRQRESGR
jgi:hypothetical protein